MMVLDLATGKLEAIDLNKKSGLPGHELESAVESLWHKLDYDALARAPMTTRFSQTPKLEQKLGVQT